MKKVFISQPMRGKTENEILMERNRIIEEIQTSIGDHEVLDTYFDDFGPGRTPGDAELSMTALSLMGLQS